MSSQNALQFKWPETKNPILLLVKMLGIKSILVFVAVVLVLKKLGIYSDTLLVFIADLFFISLAWLFIQQEIKAYKIFGWVVVFTTVFITLAWLFPSIFSITPWW